MLKMMAGDNNDAYNLAPGFILETVGAARIFTTKRKSVVTGHYGEKHAEKIISDFLEWPITRVRDALAQLAAIGRAELSKEAVESLRPSEGLPARLRAFSRVYRGIRSAR
jgi:hypothetical protein